MAAPALDILMRAIGELRPSDDGLQAIAATFGLTLEEVAAAAEPIEARPGPLAVETPREPDAEPVEVVAPTGRAPRVTRLYQLPTEDSGTAPAWLSTVPRPNLTRSVAEPSPDPLPLIPQRTARGVIKALLATPTPGGPIDVAAIARQVARGEPLRTLPLRPLMGLTRGATVVFDRGLWLGPYRQDALALLAQLRGVIGPATLRMLRCADGPPVLDPAALAIGTPVLLISDFGLSPVPPEHPRAGPTTWAAFGQAIRAAGCEVIGVVPVPEDRWPPELARSVALLHWSPDANARSARRARGRRHARVADEGAGDMQDAVDRLALACAMAARVELPLLRALRSELLPNAPPAVESALWWDEQVASRGPTAMTLDVAVLDRHRETLREHEPEFAARAAAVVARLHANAAPGLKVEEAIVRLWIERPPGWEGAIGEALRGLLAVFASAGPEPTRAVMDAARYAAAFLPEIDLPEAAIPMARDLFFAATRLLGAPLPAGIGVPSGWLAKLWTDPNTETTQIGVEWREDGLECWPDAVSRNTFPIKGTVPSFTIEADSGQVLGSVMALRDTRLPIPDGNDRLFFPTSSGERWCLENADRADGLAPLRVFVLVHPSSRADNQAYIDAFERFLRAETGLPNTAPLVMRQIGLESWRDLPAYPSRLTGGISTWRAMTSSAVQLATAFVIVSTGPMTKPDWTKDVIDMIGLRLAHEEPPQAIAVDDDGSGMEHLRSLPNLTILDWNGPRQMTEVAGARALARTVAARWRAGRLAQSASIAIYPSDSWRITGEGLPVLKLLALAFHQNSFAEMSGTLSPSGTAPLSDEFWRAVVDRLAGPETSQPAGWDFDHVLARAAHIADDIQAYLDGIDPFEPTVRHQSLIDTLKAGDDAVLTPGQLTSFGADGNMVEIRTTELRLSDVLRAFERCASPAEQTFLRERFGGEIPRSADRFVVTDDALLSLLADQLLPYATPAHHWLAETPSSLRKVRTFPEYFEAWAGLLGSYLRAAAQLRPELQATFGSSFSLGTPESASPMSYFEPESVEKTLDMARGLFPASFEYRNLQARGELSGNGMPIIDYADLVAYVCDLLAFGVRAQSSRIHRDPWLEPSTQSGDPWGEQPA